LPVQEIPDAEHVLRDAGVRDGGRSNIMPAWLVIGGLALVAVGALLLLNWFATHCPVCSKRWHPTGKIRDGGLMGGETAYMKEWHCPSCGYREEIKSK
jgi:hypothetical protein